MASSLSLGLSTYKPAAFRPQASAGSRKADPNGRPNWWTPLFGWPADGTGYITDGGEVKANHSYNNAPATEGGQGMSAGRFRPGCFTEEKARRMRRKTAEGETFHDVMYHSAIASRLALGGGGEVEEEEEN